MENDHMKLLGEQLTVECSLHNIAPPGYQFNVCGIHLTLAVLWSFRVHANADAIFVIIHFLSSTGAYCST